MILESLQFLELALLSTTTPWESLSNPPRFAFSPFYFCFFFCKRFEISCIYPTGFLDLSQVASYIAGNLQVLFTIWFFMAAGSAFSLFLSLFCLFILLLSIYENLIWKETLLDGYIKAAVMEVFFSGRWMVWNFFYCFHYVGAEIFH